MVSKTREERERIAAAVLADMTSRGLNNDEYGAIRKLKGVLREYVELGDDEPGLTGRIHFQELGVDSVLVYKLPMRECNTPFVRLECPRPMEDVSSQEKKDGYRRVRKPTKAQRKLAEDAAAAKAKK